MGTYGTAAVKSVEMVVSGETRSPKTAWRDVTNELFADTQYGPKSCPTGAFLGLCEEGLVKGISPGDYCDSEDNKDYAVAAVRVLGEKPELAGKKSALWKVAVARVRDDPVVPNSQMDVVVSLWDAGFIKGS